MVVDLKESREKIDRIDKEIAKLFEERMKVATDVAAYKRSTGKKVFDPVREEEKINEKRENYIINVSSNPKHRSIDIMWDKGNHNKRTNICGRAKESRSRIIGRDYCR